MTFAEMLNDAETSWVGDLDYPTDAMRGYEQAMRLAEESDNEEDAAMHAAEARLILGGAEL